MKATSNEKREQIVDAKLRGEKTETIILWVKVSKSTIDKVWARYQSTGSYLAKPHTGKPTRVTPEIEAKIRAKIKEQNDITLEELIEDLDLPIQKTRLAELLDEWNLSFKKRRSTQKNNSEKMCKKSEKSGKKNKKI